MGNSDPLSILDGTSIRPLLSSTNLHRDSQTHGSEHQTPSQPHTTEHAKPHPSSPPSSERIQGKVTYVWARYDFIPRGDDEIGFRAGDRIEVIERDEGYDDGWWQGRHPVGGVGLFPVDYTDREPLALTDKEIIHTSAGKMSEHTIRGKEAEKKEMSVMSKAEKGKEPEEKQEQEINMRSLTTPLLNLATSNMTAQDMFDCLLDHECKDLTLLIDLAQLSAVSYAGGAFGDIFKGMLHDGTGIAVKMLRSHVITEDVSPKWLKRVMREIYVWSKTDHPNVQELMGVAMLNSRLAMISLWMENGNLQEYIRNFPNADRYELCTQVAAGVTYLHSIDMVHGDLKALNILVSKDGIAKISDFDHSILSDCSLIFSATTNKTGGTFRWMAPELVLNEEDDDGPPSTRNKQTDVYALGMTFLEITTGNVPYAEYRSDGPIYGALMKKKFPKRPEPLSSLHKRGNLLWSLMGRCWDHIPSARPEASEVHESLTQISNLVDT